MKINLDQLSAALKNKLAPLYLISGDEPLLIMEASSQISAAGKLAGYVSQRLQLNSEYNWSNVFTDAKTGSLFEPKRLLLIDVSLAQLNQTILVELLTEYVKNPSLTTILVFTTPKLEKKIEQSTCCKLLANHGVHISIWPLSPAAFLTWLNKNIQARNLQLTANGIRLLAEYTEGNLLAAHQEIEKLALQFGNEPLTDIQLKYTLADHSHFHAFTLAECCLAGKTQRSLKIVEHLQKNALEPLLILGILARELRRLCALAEQPANQYSAIAKSLAIFPKQMSLYQAALKRQPQLQFWQNLLSTCSAIDRIIKSTKYDYSWLNLTMLCLAVAEPKEEIFLTLINALTQSSSDPFNYSRQGI